MTDPTISPATTIEDVIERAAREGLPAALIARIVGLSVAEITPFIPADVDDREQLMALGTRFRTSPLESRILFAILKNGTLTRERLTDVVGTKSADVLLCKLRKKLTPWGLTVHTVGGVGYQLSQADLEKVRAIARGERP